MRYTSGAQRLAYSTPCLTANNCYKSALDFGSSGLCHADRAIKTVSIAVTCEQVLCSVIDLNINNFKYHHCPKIIPNKSFAGAVHKARHVRVV